MSPDEVLDSVPGADRAPWWAVASSVAAPVLLIGGWTLAARLQSEPFDAVTGTISDLAALDADHRWLMTAALAGVGACHLTTALGLGRAGAAAPGRALLALGGVGSALVAVLPLPGQAGESAAHGAAAGLAFGALAAWPAGAWRRGPGVRAVLRPAVSAAAVAVLAGTLGWFVAELSADGPRVGRTERIAAAAQAVWPAVVVVGLRRRRP